MPMPNALLGQCPRGHLMLLRKAIALSLAVIAATLIVKTLFSATSTTSSATSETICGVWKEKLGDEKDMPDSERLSMANSLAEKLVPLRAIALPLELRQESKFITF